MHSTRNRFFTLLLTFALLASGSLSAQNSRAILSGAVKDESGAVLQGARITLEPAAQPETSNGQGGFFFNNLAPGNYKVTVSFCRICALHQGSVSQPGRHHAG
jgi:hypothetical protein